MDKYKETQREDPDYRFKILYAFGMIFIVSAHCMGGGISLAYEWFEPYGFHLALFAFCSGYFYKEKYEDDLLGYAGKKIKRLILPLYIWNICYGILVSVLALKGFTIGGRITISNLLITPVTTGHQFVYNLGGWFVIPLFMLEMCNVLFRKCLGFIKHDIGKELLIFFLYLFGGISGTCLAISGLNEGGWLVLARMLYFLPFFGLGRLYKTILEKYDCISNWLYFGIIFAAELLVIYKCGRIPGYTIAWCNDFIDGPIMPFVVGILGIAFWLRVSAILEASLGKSRIVNLIADNTYAIMIHHLMGFMMVKTFFALANRLGGYFADFDWVRYKSDIWYYYFPKGWPQFQMIYLVAGLSMPIILQLILNKIRGKIRVWCG